MSNKSNKLNNNKYNKEYCVNTNLRLFNINKNKEFNKKYKIFVNFKPNENIPYGGGNISVFYIIRQLNDKYNDFEVTYELEDNIDIYLIIDPFKDNKFKKYSLDDVIKHKTNGKIVIRVNDCDKTRVVTNKDSLENIKLLKLQ